MWKEKKTTRRCGDYLYHHGIVGQKWYIRRYQNYDGTLTEEGRRRLGIGKSLHNRIDNDYTIKKGSTITRISGVRKAKEKVTFGDVIAMAFGISPIRATDSDKLREVENSYSNYRYGSFDDFDGKNSENKWPGTEAYTASFLQWEDEIAKMTYTLKKDARVASGKKLCDYIVDEYGPEKIGKMMYKLEKKFSLETGEIYRDDGTIDTSKSSFANFYKEFASGRLKYNDTAYAHVMDRLRKEGYDAVEDIGDFSTKMPVIFLNPQESLGKFDSVEYMSRGWPFWSKKKEYG